MNKKIFLLLLFLSASALLVEGAVIQGGTGSNVTVGIKPNDPKPGEFVEITISGYGFDVTKTYFEWLKNGAKSKSGVGDNIYSFQLGQVGEATRINVIVISNKRKLAEKSFYFEPSEIEFSWEADSFVPPTYQGRSRASSGSTIKVVATPRIANQSGKLEKTSDLNYRWYKNDTLISSSSGLGKNILKLDTDPKDSQLKIRLIASNRSGANSASGDLIINLGQPEIAFYENRPLSGPNFQKQILASYDLYGPEASFLAVPFFWPQADYKDLDYLWRVNNTVADSGEVEEILTVRQPDGATGQNQVTLQAKTEKRSAQGRFNIKFGNNLLKFNNVE